MADIDQLQEAETRDLRDHHWKITFEVIIQGEDQDWSFDEYIVAAGPDSSFAVERLKEYVLNEEEYGVKVIGFRTLDIRLLSAADI